MSLEMKTGKISAGQWGLKRLFLIVVLIIIGWVLWIWWRPSGMDVPRYPRTVRSTSYALQSYDPDQLIQSFETTDTMDAVTKFYRRELTARGWNCERLALGADAPLKCARSPDGARPCGFASRRCYREKLTVLRRPCPATCILIYVDGQETLIPGEIN